LWVIGNYVLYGLFTIGLARTEAPPKPSSDYVRSLQRQHSLAMGRPLLIAMFYGSIAFSAIGLLGTLFSHDRISLLFAFVFFGICALVFRRAIKSIDT
jgi:uncharacterized protein (DUF2062 family)